MRFSASFIFNEIIQCNQMILYYVVWGYKFAKRSRAHTYTPSWHRPCITIINEIDLCRRDGDKGHVHLIHFAYPILFLWIDASFPRKFYSHFYTYIFCRSPTPFTLPFSASSFNLFFGRNPAYCICVSVIVLSYLNFLYLN